MLTIIFTLLAMLRQLSLPRLVRQSLGLQMANYRGGSG